MISKPDWAGVAPKIKSERGNQRRRWVVGSEAFETEDSSEEQIRQSGLRGGSSVH